MMKDFKKGDVVRLLFLDGKISNETFVIHDLWGDDTCARNASYITSGFEQHYHTDLMISEKNVSPDNVVPDGGEWYIARGNNMGWGRAQTIEQAVSNMRRQGGKTTSYVVHRVSKWTMVDGMGSLTYPHGIDPVEVKRVEPKKAKVKHG